MDFVPNHSSDEHEWFVKSSDPNNPEYEKYKDYYVWVTPNFDNETEAPIIPNNWVSSERKKKNHKTHTHRQTATFLRLGRFVRRSK